MSESVGELEGCSWCASRPSDRQDRTRDSAARRMAADGGKPRVVVVGGGIGGALLAKTLQPDADVVLLDP